MSERKALGGGDWLAIGTFLAGALVAVLMGMALLRGVESAQGTGALAAAIAGVLGALPGLVLGAGVAFLGGRAFLTGETGRLARGVLGTLGIAVGLAILVGAFSADGGGAIGAAIGGRAAALTHATVGALLGALVVFGAAWFAWLREDPALAARLAAPRRATSAPPRADEGVSAAESAMLFPAKEEAARAAAKVVATPSTPAAKPAPAAKPVAPAPAAKAPPAAKAVPPHPYPEDVRLKGEVPPGAKPLTAPGVAAEMDVPEAPPAVYRWTAPRAHAADETMAPAHELDSEAAEPEPLAATLQDAGVEPLEVAAEALLVEEELVEQVELRPMPPRPSWETTGLTEEDEPVDAYGTPLSLVERVRRERDEEEGEADAMSALPIPREIGAVEDEPDVEPDADEETEIVAELHEAGVNGHDLVAGREASRGRGVLDAAVAEDVDEDAYVVEEALEEIVEIEAVVADAEAVEVDDEEELDEEAEEDLEGIVGEVTVAHEAGLEDETDELEDEELVEDELEEEEELEADEEVLAEEDLDETDVLEEEESEEEIEASTDADEEADEDAEELEEVELRADEPAPAPAASPAPARAKPAARGLFDADDDAPAQREVVLQPQAAVPPTRAEKSPGHGLDPRQKLLAEVGCMFVERGRVAVSMLQRQYDMDFDEACRVLDDLQEMGLIGPYLGGQRRDILLSRDQWLQKVGSA